MAGVRKENNKMKQETTKQEQRMHELMKAKENVSYLLGNADALVDMHGISYWACRVERLRKEIKEDL